MGDTEVKLATQKIGLLNTIFMVLLSLGIFDHVLLIPILLAKGRRDAWIGVLVAMCFALLWVPILSAISNRTNQQSISQWLSQKYGNVIRYLFIVPIALFLFVANLIMVKDTVGWISTNYLYNTPPLAIALFLVLICFFATKTGIRNIAYTSGILCPFVLVFGYFIMTANLPKKDYHMIMPLLEHGMNPVWKSAFYAFAAMTELFILLLFQHHLDKKVSYVQLAVFVLLLAELTIGPMIGAIAAFGVEGAVWVRDPAFEQWRLLQLGKYIGRLDFMAIYQWMSGACIRISLFNFLILDLFEIRNGKGKNFFLLILSLLLAAVVLLPIGDMKFLSLMKDYYPPLLLSLFFGGSILLYVLTLFRSKKEVNV